MKLFLLIVILCVLMFGWNEVENTNGRVLKNFGKGMLIGLIYGCAVGSVISFVLFALGV